MSGIKVSKSDAVPVIQDWLGNTYRMQDGETLSKRDVYADYLEFCADNNIPSTNPSTFGKILKLVFPQLTSRRIGPRGDSFPHYNSFTRIVPRPDTNKCVPQRRVIKGKRKTRKPPASENTDKEDPGALKPEDCERGKGQKAAAAKRTKKRARRGSLKHTVDSAEQLHADSRQAMQAELDAILEEDEDDSNSNNGTAAVVLQEGVAVVQQQVVGHESPLPFFEHSTEAGTSHSLCSPARHVMALQRTAGITNNIITVNNNHHTHSSLLAFGGLVPTTTAATNSIIHTIHNNHNHLVFGDAVPTTTAATTMTTNGTNMLCRNHGVHAQRQPTDSFVELLSNGLPGENTVANNPLVFSRHGCASMSLCAPANAHGQNGQRAEEEEGMQEMCFDAAMWDTHLQFVAVVDAYRTYYYRFVYATNPINPATLDMHNIQYLVCTTEGAAERSVLSLNVYFLLSVGSLYVGDFERAREFFNTTRDHLGYVFDTTDYSLALVLIPLSFLARYWADSEEEGAKTSNYYLTLGKTICETLGCINTPLYVRFTQSLAWFDHSNLEEEVQRQEGLPYFPTLTSDSMRVLFTDHDQLPDADSCRNQQCTFLSCIGVIGSVLKGIMAYKMHRVMRDRWDRYISLNDASETTKGDGLDVGYHLSGLAQSLMQELKAGDATSTAGEAGGVDEAVDVGLGLREEDVEDEQEEAEVKVVEVVRPVAAARQPQQPAKEGEVVFGKGLTLMKLMDVLGNTEKSLRARMTSDKPLPKHILLFLKEFLWAEEAIIFHYLNEPNLAMKVIKYFILSLKGFRNVLNFATLLEVPMGMIMEVLMKNNELDLFNEVLTMLDAVAHHSPAVQRMKERFLLMDADNFW